MTLYLKYRPQTIGDLDLKSVRETLTNILSKTEIPHAFLFAGPKGTGKTSAARILAKALNCEGKEGLVGIEPCNKCMVCTSITKGENLDVIEIDAASHRGIDDIRSLREAVKLSPVSARKKVYIIDEAHMLTTEACNALLKVLEEPPSHVVFVLATTNPEKLIDTIRSRTTLVPFTKATEEDVVKRLKKIAQGEGVDLDNKDQGDMVLGLIAKASDGAFRDGVKLFEQIISEKVELTNEGVSQFLFGSKSFDPEKFLATLIEEDAKGALVLIEQAVTQGLSAKNMAKGILDVLRRKMLSEVGAKEETIALLELFSNAYSEIPNAYLEQLPLEIAAVKWCGDINKQKTINNKQERREERKKTEAAPGKENSQQSTINSQRVEQRQIPDRVRNDEVPKAESQKPMAEDADTVVS